MRLVSLALSCALLLSFSACATHSRSTTRAERRSYEQAARTAALQWLQLLDAHEYGEAFDRESARLRVAGTEGQFTRSMNGRREPLGRVKSRVFIGAAFTKKMSSAPDGKYESILFKTSFEHKAAATAERVILSKEHGRWRVTDYRIY